MDARQIVEAVLGHFRCDGDYSFPKRVLVSGFSRIRNDSKTGELLGKVTFLETDLSSPDLDRILEDMEFEGSILISGDEIILMPILRTYLQALEGTMIYSDALRLRRALKLFVGFSGPAAEEEL